MRRNLQNRQAPAGAFDETLYDILHLRGCESRAGVLEESLARLARLDRRELGYQRCACCRNALMARQFVAVLVEVRVVVAVQQVHRDDEGTQHENDSQQQQCDCCSATLPAELTNTE